MLTKMEKYLKQIAPSFFKGKKFKWPKKHMKEVLKILGQKEMQIKPH
jgi:hypothetical protein